MVLRTYDFATMQITEYQSSNKGVQAYFSSIVYLDGFIYLGGTQGVDSTNPQASLATLSKIKAANSGSSLITDFVWFYRMSAQDGNYKHRIHEMTASTVDSES